MILVAACLLACGCTSSNSQQLMTAARASYSKQEVVNARRLADEAFSAAEGEGSNGRLHEAFTFMSNTLNQKPDEIMSYGQRAMKFAEKQNDDKTSFGWAAEIGLYLVEHKEYAQAEPYLKVAVEEYVRMHGKDDPHLAGLVDGEPGKFGQINYDIGLYRELANVYEKQGKYGLAEPLRRQILSMEEPGILKAKGRHSDLAGTAEKLADDLVGQKKYDEAEKYYKRAIEIYRSRVKKHPSENESDKLLRDEETLLAASPLAQLAEQYRQQHKFAESERLFKRVLDCDLVENGPKSVDAEAWKLNYAKLLRQTGRAQEGDTLEEGVQRAREMRLQFSKH